ncbi:hypothetical protein [Aliicoccus persicus]|uniref:PH domain-containing protein n=1 Tax=Aliicoccus persicus TaxID=930138 RepID=A0A662Z305_9STAP|nr:hypothetical protein [Aliicoccus persicus]SEV95362.1 PH domain-containing protein [Aliicoccus persicus]
MSEVDILNITESDLYPTERFGPKLVGTMLYKLGETSAFKTAYITTNERLIMNADMNGELYTRVFSYQDIEEATFEKDGVIITFKNGMKIPMVEIIDGNTEAFLEFVKERL